MADLHLSPCVRDRRDLMKWFGIFPTDSDDSELEDSDSKLDSKANTQKSHFLFSI